MPFTHSSHLNPEQIFLRSNEYTILNNSTKKSSISFNLKKAVRIPLNVDCFIQLTSFKFTNAFYNVNSNNNMLYFSLNGSGETLSTIYIVEIPTANYNITSLMSFLNTELAGHIVFTYDASRFKINITSSLYTFVIRSGHNDCLKLLGLSGTTTESNDIISQNLVNLSGTQVLYITLDNLTVASNSSTNSGINNILESINIDVITGNSKSFYNSSTIKYKVVESYIDKLNVNIYDENNILVDFNNTDWYMSISLIFSYKNEYKPPPSLDINNLSIDQPIQNELEQI